MADSGENAKNALMPAAYSLLVDEFMDDEFEGNILRMFTAHFTNLSLGAATAVMGNSSKTPVRVEDYVVGVVPRYTNTDFRSHFRMTKTSFEELCVHIAPIIKRRQQTVEMKLLSALWLLSNQESFRGVADRFGVSKGSLHLILMNVCSTLASMKAQFIAWPEQHELQEIVEGFKQRCGFPGAVGAIDGTHIPIPGLTGHHRASYINRKGFASIQLQVVCDNKLKFLDVYTGWPGAVHDSRVFRNSALHEMLENGSLSPNLHLIGDSAYPLRPYLLVPFRDNGQLGPLEKKFNKAHSSTRVDVERAIGLLKCKFRRLKYLDMHPIDEIPPVIMAACVLHNFILMRENCNDDLEEAGQQADEWAAHPDARHNELPPIAAAKRLEIANSLA